MIVVAIGAAIAAVLAALVAGIKRILRGTRTIGGAVIHTPTDDTRMDRSGAVRSVQGADIVLPEDTLEDIWDPQHLERLARTYWSFLSDCTLGLIKVHYTEGERYVKLLGLIPLLTFDAPEYEIDERRGCVRWRIKKGLLVQRKAHHGDGYLQVEVRRLPCTEPERARINVEVTVANFYPQVARALSTFVYTNTQSRIHVIVTHGFLRRLVTRRLDQSVAGRFAAPEYDEMPV
ncbi:MAG TPA: hypothetical protein VFZ89_18160 [Solirubrobacteraceae bacterium]